MRDINLLAATLFLCICQSTGIAAANDFETADINLRVGTYLADGKPLSCEEGRHQLEERGFQPVETVDCGVESFTYRAFRAGANYEVVVTGEDGRITRRTSF